MRPRLLLLFGAILAASTAARATPNFPAAIDRDLQLSTPPACTICHATNEGGTGTVVKPFGKYLVSRGLVPFDEGSLAGALAAAGGEHHDSDGDGVSDIDALQRGLDPNGSASQAPRVEDPQFGAAQAAGASGAPGLHSLPSACGWESRCSLADAVARASEPRSRDSAGSNPPGRVGV